MPHFVREVLCHILDYQDLQDFHAMWDREAGVYYFILLIWELIWREFRIFINRKCCFQILKDRKDAG